MPYPTAPEILASSPMAFLTFSVMTGGGGLADPMPAGPLTVGCGPVGGGGTAGLDGAPMAAGGGLAGGAFAMGGFTAFAGGTFDGMVEWSSAEPVLALGLDR